MKNLLLFLLLLLSAHLTAQTVIVGGGNMCKVNGDPDLNVKLAQQDQRYECSIAWDTLGNKFYVYRASDPAGSRWDELTVSSTPLTAGTGILISGDTIYSTGDPSSTNELQALVVAANAITLSGSGGSATIAGGGGNIVTTSGTTITVTAPTPNGAETKVTQGAGITVGGIGTIGSPYVVTNTAPDQTVTIAGAGGNNVTGAYPNFTVTGTPANGAETKVNEGTGIHVTGLGTTSSPYVVNSTITQANGSETKVTQGSNVTVTGTGTTGDPYIVNSSGGGGGAALPAQQIGYGNTSSIVSDAAFTRLVNTVSIGASDTTGRLNFNRPVDSKYAIVFSGNGSTAADRFIKIKKDPALSESIITDFNIGRITIPNHDGGGNNQIIYQGFDIFEGGNENPAQPSFADSWENNYSNDGAGTVHPYVFERQIGQVTYPSGHYRRPISLIVPNSESDMRGSFLTTGDYYTFKDYAQDSARLILSTVGPSGYGGYQLGFSAFDKLAWNALNNNYSSLKQQRTPGTSNLQNLIMYDAAGILRLGAQVDGDAAPMQLGNNFSIGRTGEIDQIFPALGDGATNLSFGKSGKRFRDYSFSSSSEINNIYQNDSGKWALGMPADSGLYLYNYRTGGRTLSLSGRAPGYSINVDTIGNVTMGGTLSKAKLTLIATKPSTTPLQQWSNNVGLQSDYLVAYNPNSNISVAYPGDLAKDIRGKYWLKVTGNGTATGWAELLTTASAFDADTTNELQTISRTANTLSLSKGGGTVSINRTFVTGTANFIPKITDTPDSLANSVFYQATGGKIGLNTTIPQTVFDVVDNTSVTTFAGINNAGLRISGASGTDKYSLLQFSGNASNPIGQIGLKQTASGSLMEFGTSNSYGTGITNTAMRIDYDGKVGIGASSNPLARLHVGMSAAATADILRLETTGNSATGNLARLLWSGRTAGDTTRRVNGAISIRNVNAGAANSTDMVFSTALAGTLNDRMAITPDGKVGIGTYPTQGLDVAANVRLQGAIYDNSNNPGTSGQYPASTGSGFNWTTLPDASNTNELQTISIAGSDITLSGGGGTVTVPSAAATNLTYSGSGPFTLNSSTGTDVTVTAGTGTTITGTSTNLTLATNLSTGIGGGQTAIGGTGASENLTITSTTNATKGKILLGPGGTSAYDEQLGNLGVGTTSPTFKMQVGSGQLAVPDGSVSAPGFTFASDANTGMYRAASDNFAIAAGGHWIAQYEYASGTTQRAVLQGRTGLTGNSVNNDLLRMGLEGSNALVSHTLDGTTGSYYVQPWTAGVGFNNNTFFNNLGGNFGIGGMSTLSSRLHVRGAGTTSSTSSLRVENSAGTVTINSRDDGAVSIGSSVPQTGYALTTVGDAYFTANAVVAGAAAGQTANTLWGRNTAGFLIPITFNPAHITLTSNVLDVTGANPVVAAGNNANIATSTLSGITTYRVDQGLGAVAWKGDTLVSNINAQLDNWVPGGWGTVTTGTAGKTIIEISLTGNQVLTGVDNPIDGRFLVIRNLDATDKLTVKNQSASSTGANRFSLLRDYDILPGQQATFQYSVLKGSWILWGHQDATVVYYIEGQTGTTFDLDAASGAIKDVDGNTITDYFPPNLDAVTITKNGLVLGRTGTATTRGYSINAATQVITLAVAALVTDNYTIKLEK